MLNSKSLITNEGRECSRCKEFKPWSSFSNNTSGVRGHQSFCKTCDSVRRKKTTPRAVPKPRAKAPIDREGRTCTTCKEFKPWSQFVKDKSRRTGYANSCKTCDTVYREKRKHEQKQPLAKAPNCVKGVVKVEGRTCSKCGAFKTWDNFAKNSNGINGHRSKCKTCAHAETKTPEYKAKDKLRRDKNHARILAAHRRRYHANLERRREHSRKKQRHYRATNPTYVTGKRLRSRMHAALIGKVKSASTVELLGAPIEQVRAHIEAQFKPGMSWDTYGHKTFHIDHIIPIASFDLTDPEEQKKAFHYTNLQPLWAHQNLSKGAKLNWQP